jgi:hypothetical protein
MHSLSSSFSSSRNTQLTAYIAAIRYYIVTRCRSPYILTWELLLSCWHIQPQLHRCTQKLMGISSRQIMWRWYEQCGRNVRHLTSLSCSYQEATPVRRVTGQTLSPLWRMVVYWALGSTLSPMASADCSSGGFDVVVLIAPMATTAGQVPIPFFMGGHIVHHAYRIVLVHCGTYISFICVAILGLHVLAHPRLDAHGRSTNSLVELVGSA